MTASALEASAETERMRAATMGIHGTTDHARERWDERAPHAEADVDEAWKQAKPVHYPSASRGAVARYHRPTDTVILARQGSIVTCIDLMDRQWSERIYIRRQVISE